MTLRIFAAVLILGGLTDDVAAQRGFRRGYYGPKARSTRPQAEHHHHHHHHAPIQMPYYPPYFPTYGGQFAPVQYFTPPVVINGYWPNAGYYYGRPYVRRQFATGGLVVTGPPKLQAPPMNASIASTANKPIEIEPDPVKIQKVAAGDRVAAIRFQAEGDSLFRTGNLNRAFSAYRASLQADASRPEPYFRMSTLFAAMRSYDPAVRYLKQGLDFAPAFAKSGDRLDAMYGPARAEMKEMHLAAVVGWAKQNLKSPDRQLLAGAMLHFDDQQNAALPFLERTSQLSLRPSRATALLSARDSSFVPKAPGPPGLLLQPQPEQNPLPPPTLEISKEAAVPAAPKLPTPDSNVPPDPTGGS